MVLPFLYDLEWLDITSASDLTNMGRIHLDSFTNLQNANSVSGQDVNITVYAWAENVTIAGLTTRLALQGDEYSSSGPISKPASAIARAAGMLENLPIIGSYMTSTRMAAETIGETAACFGYTKVPVIDNVTAFKNLPFHGLASADIGEPCEKLTVDSKNELTIDPTTISPVPGDPLSISQFVGRKSYLTQFTWTSVQAQDTLLWNCRVQPSLANITTATGQHVVSPTPMWMLARCFEFWRGDIIFEFDIICSKYHRGRLKINWDPRGDPAELDTSTTEIFTHIVDISHDTKCTIRVPFTQLYAYKPTDTGLTSAKYSTTALAALGSNTFGNGTIGVTVLNEQTSPVTSADIQILVSVYGAENLEFAAPNRISPDIQFFTVQGSTLDDTKIDVISDFGAPSTTDKNLNLMYMGESIVI
jgi:hypothetical protein